MQMALFGEVMMEATAVSTLSPVASLSPVRESVTKAIEKDLTTKGAGCGEITPVSFARYDPVTSSLRTSVLCLDGEAQEFCATLPKAGMMRNGELFALGIGDMPTNAHEFLSLPTPTRSDYKGGTDKPRLKGGRLVPRDDELKHYLKLNFGGTYPNPSFLEAIMGFPTGWGVLRDAETQLSPILQNTSEDA